MRQRCADKNDVSYAIYGGRGIKVCPEWRSFEKFIADVGEKPTPAHTLDRIDPDGDYEPGNVRWATRKEQSANRRKGIYNRKGKIMAKEKPLKTKWLGARADDKLSEDVNAYMEAADMTMGDLIRKATREYMQNHPIKQPEEPAINKLKPGEE